MFVGKQAAMNHHSLVKFVASCFVLFAPIVFTNTFNELNCVKQKLSYHPNPPVRSQVCVNTTDPCTTLEPGIKYCKRGTTGLWRLVRCDPGYELHVVKIKKSESEFEFADLEAGLGDVKTNTTTDETHSQNQAANALRNQEYYWGSCHDINECERGEEVHSCSHICKNVPGTFKCKCPIGFALARDGRTCLSIAKNLISLVGMFFSQSVDYISDHKL